MSTKDRSKIIKISDGVFMEVVNEKYNSLVKRLELECIISHVGRGTPSRREVREALSKEYSRPLEGIHVREITSLYGCGMSMVRVNIYDDSVRASLFEPKYILKRDGVVS